MVAPTNQKGGVGKTTTAINLAAALAMRGKRTLLIDLDPQANSSMSYLDLTTVEKSTYDVLMGEKTLSDIVRETQVQNLDLAPARISLAKAENKLIGELEGHFKLRDALYACKRKYDFIVIDTPPTLGIITANALVASSHVLVPVQSSYFALEGTEDLLETVEKIRARPNRPEAPGSGDHHVRQADHAGMAAGSILAGKLSGDHVEYGLIPLGAILMAAMGFWLGVDGISRTAFTIGLAVLGIGGGLFIVPIAAVLQHRPPADRKGSVQGAASWLSWVGIAGAALVQKELNIRLGWSPGQVFWFCASCAVIAGIYVAKTRPSALPNMLARWTGGHLN